jgi:carboxypeptidase Taq
MQARENNDFKLFEAPLQRLIELHRQLAEKLDPGAHPYDALLEEYDPGSKIESLKPMFARLGAGLNEFLNALATSTVTPYTFNETLEVPDQTRLMQRVARDMGFDFEAGRLDVSEHPFTLGMDATDVRITIKPNRSNLLGMLGSLIHEGGHGLYEQGLPMELAGTGLNRAAGMGLHESQSRLWENFIGRSHAFAQYLLPRMQGIWPTLELTVDQLFGALNRVERSLIRVMADEVTYNLHIIVRFELEVAILEGKLQAKDLPDAWDMGYKQQVGIVASIAKEGVLQDIHWSSGLFGYFPSYTIGNLYAASIGATLQEQNPGLWEEVAKGDFRWILGWLRQHIHQRGHRKDAPLLFAEAVGDRDPVADLLNYVWKRHGAIYGVQRT